jgi:hypothetical protein
MVLCKVLNDVNEQIDLNINILTKEKIKEDPLSFISYSPSINLKKGAFFVSLLEIKD